MDYERIVGQAPGTNTELFKSAILAALKDINKRLLALEPKDQEGDKPDGS